MGSVTGEVVKHTPPPIGHCCLYTHSKGGDTTHMFKHTYRHAQSQMLSTECTHPVHRNHPDTHILG